MTTKQKIGVVLAVVVAAVLVIGAVRTADDLARINPVNRAFDTVVQHYQQPVASTVERGETCRAWSNARLADVSADTTLLADDLKELRGLEGGHRAEKVEEVQLALDALDAQARRWRTYAEHYERERDVQEIEHAAEVVASMVAASHRAARDGEEITYATLTSELDRGDVYMLTWLGLSRSYDAYLRHEYNECSERAAAVGHD